MSTHTTYVTGYILEDQADLTLDDLCRACSVQASMMVELVHEGVLLPEGSAQERWRFTGIHLQRAKVATRLQRDLGVNLAGAALALELMEELERLRGQLLRLES